MLPDKNFANSVLHLTHRFFGSTVPAMLGFGWGYSFTNYPRPISPDHGEWEQCGGSPFSFFQEGGVVVKKS